MSGGAASLAWVLFPAALHTPLYVDPRAPLSRVSLHTEGVDVGLGQQLVFAGARGADWRMDVGLTGGVYASFVPDTAMTFHFLTFDGIFGVPVDLRWRNLEARLQWTHHSAHYGDGIRRMDLEQVPSLDEVVDVFSREWVGLTLGAHVLSGVAGLHDLYLFGGGRTIYPAVDDGGGSTLLSGIQADWREARGGPYAAAMISAAQEQDWTPGLSAQVGVHMGRMRLGAVAYQGHNLAGKQSNEVERHVGLQLLVDPQG